MEESNLCFGGVEGGVDVAFLVVHYEVKIVERRKVGLWVVEGRWRRLRCRGTDEAKRPRYMYF